MPERSVDPLTESRRRPCREHESCEIVDRHGYRLHIYVGTGEDEGESSDA